MANHFSDLFSNQGVQSRLQAYGQSNFLLQLPVLFLLSLSLIASQLSNLIIRYYRQSSNLSFLNYLSYLASQLAQLYLSVKCIHSNVPQFIYVGSELIIIGWAFIHEINKLSPLNLSRFFVTAQQLIYNKSKIEKQAQYQFRYFSIRHQCSIARNLSIWENNILATTDTPFFGSSFVLFVLLRG